MGTKYDDDFKRELLNRLALDPSLKRIARQMHVNSATVFTWLRQSKDDPDANSLEWLGRIAPLHLHVEAARALNKIALDHEARALALNGHSEPKFHDGKPVWRTDPKRAADAIALANGTMADFEWVATYPGIPLGDTFMRDDKGALVQEEINHPPNPQLLNRVLAATMPDLYGDHQTIEHHISGSVWIEGGVPTKQIEGPKDGVTEVFALASKPSDQQRPVNVLALPRPCANSDEFDLKFRKLLVREVTLFYDDQQTLRPPLPDDVVVAGTRQARVFQDAGIECKVVRAEDLLDEGFENPFLYELAPGYKPKPKPKPNDPPPLPADEVATLAAQKMAERAVPAGKASARYDSENIGRGTPASGGRSVVR